MTSAAAATKPKAALRHTWAEPVRFLYKTERQCAACGLVKVTRHEASVWIEYWRDGDKIDADQTPMCEGRSP